MSCFSCTSLQLKYVLDYSCISPITKKTFVDETNLQTMKNLEKVYTFFHSHCFVPLNFRGENITFMADQPNIA